MGTLLDQREVYLSVITEMEMLGYPGITDSEIKQIKQFIVDCQVFDISPTIKERTIELRRKHNLKLPDAIIAATAMEHNLPLISADGIFARIEDINFVHYSM